MPETQPGFQPVRIALLNGTPAVVRRIMPEDAARLARGLERLSSKSRTERFFYNKTRFSEKELYELTRHDVRTHLALVLGILDGAGTETDIVAVARCFRDQREPDCGEVAFTTIDEWQGVGIGTALLRELARCCREAGIVRWKAVFLAGNRRPQKFLEAVGHKLVERDTGSGSVEAVYALDSTDRRPGPGGGVR